MVDIREIFEKDIGRAITIVDSLKANVGIFGGRYYTFSIDQKVTGSLSLKEVIQLTQHHFQSNSGGTVGEQSNLLGHALIALHKRGETELSHANIFQRLLTIFKRLFGNINFNREQVLLGFVLPTTKSETPPTITPKDNKEALEAFEKNFDPNQPLLKALNTIENLYNQIKSNPADVLALKTIVREKINKNDFQKLMSELLAQNEFDLFIALYNKESDLDTLIGLFPTIASEHISAFKNIMGADFFKALVEKHTSLKNAEADRKDASDSGSHQIHSCICALVTHLSYLRSQKFLQPSEFNETLLKMIDDTNTQLITLMLKHICKDSNSYNKLFNSLLSKYNINTNIEHRRNAYNDEVREDIKKLTFIFEKHKEHFSSEYSNLFLINAKYANTADIIFFLQSEELTADEFGILIKSSQCNAIVPIFNILTSTLKAYCFSDQHEGRTTPILAAGELLLLYVNMSDKDRQLYLPNFKDTLANTLNKTARELPPNEENNHKLKMLAQHIFNQLSTERQQLLFPEGLHALQSIFTT